MSARNHAQLPSTLNICTQSHFKNSLTHLSLTFSPPYAHYSATSSEPNFGLVSSSRAGDAVFLWRWLPPAPSQVPPQHRVSGGGAERSRGGDPGVLAAPQALGAAARWSTSLRSFPPSLSSSAAIGLLGISQRYCVRLHIPGSICRSRGCTKSLNSILL